MDIYKIKMNGMKVKVQTLADTDIIDEQTFYRNEGYDKWIKSACVGDRVGNHPNREYIKILSPWVFKK